MSVKFYDKEQNKWVIFPGTLGAPGKDAYIIAQENGYTGTKQDYSYALSKIPDIVNIVSNADSVPTEESYNLVLSGGTWQAIKDVSNRIDSNNEEITSINESITNINNEITGIKTDIPEQIKGSIVDNLNSYLSTKSLSANQGRILREMIDNLVNLHIEVVDELPEVGNVNVIYLVKKEGTTPDIHDEYVYISNRWERIGNTEVDLSGYYTKDQVFSKSEINNMLTNVVASIPEVETNITGDGNIVTSVTRDLSNKHRINVTKNISVYTKEEINAIFNDSSIGNVRVQIPFTEASKIIISSGPGKTISQSSILIGDIATKTYVTERNVPWTKIVNKPETYTPSAHTHSVEQVEGLGIFATKNVINKSDLNFAIPDTIATSDAYGGIKVGYVTNGKNYAVQLSDGKAYVNVPWVSGTNLIYSSGTNIEINGTTINCTYTLPTATSSTLGGIKVGNNITLSSGTISLTNSNINTALGYTPANTNDIPSSLPNPYMLSITADNSITTYNGEISKSLNLDSIFEKKLPTASNPGNYGIYINLTASGTITATSSNLSTTGKEGIVIINSAASLNIVGDEYKLIDGFNNINNSTSGQYKCYCFQWINNNIILVNVAIYG